MSNSNVSPPAGGAGSNRFLYGYDTRPFDGDLVIASWNVEGLSEIKLWELTSIMGRRHIDILCIQETHIIQSPYYSTDSGYLVILSGSSSGDREYAGVGFIVAPWAKHAVAGFLQFSNRLACMKFRVKGGLIGVISAYAPHSGYAFDIRQCFFEDLASMLEKTSVNKMELIYGDLNSRIHRQQAGEEQCFGEHVFGNPRASLEANSNRELLLEFCSTYGMAVSNTFVERPAEELVTFRSLGTAPMHEVTFSHFAQLDFLLVRQDLMHHVLDVGSFRSESLASQHFLLESRLHSGGIASPLSPKKKRLIIDRTLLKSPKAALSFKDVFEKTISEGIRKEDCSLDQIADKVTSSFNAAASALTKDSTARKSRPWISQETIELIQDRQQARIQGQHAEERELHKRVRTSAKLDRKQWLSDLASSNSWANLRKMRTKKKHPQGRLKDSSGHFVESSERAQTFAEYLQDVQWAVRPAKLTEEHCTHQVLGVDASPISLKELRIAVGALRENKATGPDNHPLEFWKSILDIPGPNLTDGASWLLELCNRSWLGHSVPEAWHLQQVALIYKKGDSSDCGNYRPICLLNAAYKIFAWFC